MPFRFFGGVHPRENKEPANGSAVRKCPLPDQVVIPMSLHIGAPCQPLVAVGDEVKLGQKIGDSPAPVSAPIHASVSGKVIAVEPRLHSNGAECEPYISSDHRTMLEHPDEVLRGIRLIMRACGVPKAFFAIEENKLDAIRLLRQRGAADMGIEIMQLKCRYPQGAEKQLVQTVTGREIPPGGLPAAVGCAVFNTFTAYSVCRAAYEGRPAIERVVTVAGSAVKEPCNLLVRVGTPLEHVFTQAGGFKEPPKKVLMGGPMMGNAMYDLSVGTTKGTNALLAFCADEDQTVENPVCIRCGRCVAACPMRLQPLYLFLYEQSDNYDAMRRYHITDCIECGACTYNCPGRLHLTHSCRTGKAKLAALAAREKAAAEAKKKTAEEAGKEAS